MYHQTYCECPEVIEVAEIDENVLVDETEVVILEVDTLVGDELVSLNAITAA
jgi:hypothetical protein